MMVVGAGVLTSQLEGRVWCPAPQPDRRSHARPGAAPGRGSMRLAGSCPEPARDEASRSRENRDLPDHAGPSYLRTFIPNVGRCMSYPRLESVAPIPNARSRTVGDRWGPLRLDSAPTRWHIQNQAGRSPLKFNDLRNEPIRATRLPTLDVAGARPVARSSVRQDRGTSYDIAGVIMCPAIFRCGTSGAQLRPGSRSRTRDCGASFEGSIRAHRLRVASWRLAEQPRVFPAELRSARVSDLVGNRLGARSAREQQPSRFL
jgi:hypothetical protein